MKIDPRIRVYGDLNHRNPKTPKENEEQKTLVNQVRKKYPHLLFTSVKNEGKRLPAQVQFEQAMGMNSGVSDLVFFGNPTLCLEMKCEDHTKSTWQPSQQEFLIKSQEQGCFSCVCFGWEAGLQAVEDWMKIIACNNK